MLDMNKWADISDNINKMDEERRMLERNNLWGHIFVELKSFEKEVECSLIEIAQKKISKN